MMIFHKRIEPVTQWLPSSNNLQVLDNKEFPITVEQHRAGMTCRTCVFFHLALELEPDVHPDKTHPKYKLDDEWNLYVVNQQKAEYEPIGVCTRHQGYLFTGIAPWDTCPYYTERDPRFQFIDTTLTDDEDPHLGPVAHRVLT